MFELLIISILGLIIIPPLAPLFLFAIFWILLVKYPLIAVIAALLVAAAWITDV